MNKIETLGQKVCEEYDADIIFYFGPVDRPTDDFLIDECPSKKKRKNIILFIATFGGQANPAYRIARTIKKNYPHGRFYAYVCSTCASAGTLMVLGADELILSDHAELGPIDAQLKKQDEIGERTSGLTPLHALECLQEQSMLMFEMHFSQLRFNRGFSTNSAANIATSITNGLMGALYQQVDPIRIAEVNRFIRIAADYSARIAKNLKTGALDRLLKQYPSHDFVIDPQEAAELFVNVSQPKTSLEALGNELKSEIEKYLYGTQPKVAYFHLPKPVDPPPHNEIATPSTANAKDAQPANGKHRGGSNASAVKAGTTKTLH